MLIAASTAPCRFSVNIRKKNSVCVACSIAWEERSGIGEEGKTLFKVSHTSKGTLIHLSDKIGHKKF